MYPCTGTVTTFLKIYEFIYLNFKVIISRTIFNNLFKIYIFRHSPKYLHLNPVVKEKSKYTNIKEQLASPENVQKNFLIAIFVFLLGYEEF